MPRRTLRDSSAQVGAATQTTCFIAGNSSQVSCGGLQNFSGIQRLLDGARRKETCFPLGSSCTRFSGGKDPTGARGCFLRVSCVKYYRLLSLTIVPRHPHIPASRTAGIRSHFVFCNYYIALRYNAWPRRVRQYSSELATSNHSISHRLVLR